MEIKNVTRKSTDNGEKVFAEVGENRVEVNYTRTRGKLRGMWFDMAMTTDYTNMYDTDMAAAAFADQVAEVFRSAGSLAELDEQFRLGISGVIGD